MKKSRESNTLLERADNERFLKTAFLYIHTAGFIFFVKITCFLFFLLLFYLLLLRTNYYFFLFCFFFCFFYYYVNKIVIDYKRLNEISRRFKTIIGSVALRKHRNINGRIVCRILNSNSWDTRFQARFDHGVHSVGAIV